MLSSTKLSAFLLAAALLPLTLSATYHHNRVCEETHVVRHFHAGPDGPGDCTDGPDDTYIYSEDVDRCHHRSHG